MKAEGILLIAIALCIVNLFQSRELARKTDEIIKLRITLKELAMKLKEMEDD